MAARALPPGALKRRAAFGLLDADGWTWAFFKALFWFLTIIFLLGYIPDRAYYFTVAKTIDVGFNAVPLVNWCPGDNGSIPCPAPAGAVVPWQPNPDQLALPEGRAGAAAFQSGVNLYLVGGRTSAGATEQVLATVATTDGNFAEWEDGPALPEARDRFALASLSGVPYVIGGLDASGEPTTTVFQGQLEQGVLTGWEEVADLVLPVAMSDGMAVGTSAGVVLVGGRTQDGLASTVYIAAFGEGNPPTLGAWAESPVPLPEPRASGSAVLVGDQLYQFGGEGPDGTEAEVYRLTLDEGQLLIDPETGDPQGWAAASSVGQQLPEPRAEATSFTANGTVYVIGGLDANGQPQASNLWVVPGAEGDLPSWQRRTETDLPEPRAAAAVTTVGSFAFLIGGDGTAGALDTSLRANLSPGTPFFRLGLFGATVPAMAIEGEIGQQLGYINAFGVGSVNFVVLLAIAWAYSHRQGTLRFIERISRGRFRAPREEEYPVDVRRT